jgi:uncharacterized protein
MLEDLIYLTDVAELRPPYREPGVLARVTQLDRIDPHCRTFIAHSPLVVIGSADTKGGLDVSPRGDAPGFVQVLDDHHLAIPDRPGNNRLDTLQNLLANPAIGLLFIIPGVDDALRVNGTARLTRAPSLLETMAVEARVPKLAIVVTVTEAFLHCAKALRRARLWSDDYRIDRRQLPTLGRMIVEQTSAAGLTAHEANARIEADYRTNLY